MPQQWVVIVPVKELRLAKTRLTQFSEQARADFALAAARDVVAAARSCSAVTAVYAVTNDVLVAETLAADGAQVIADAPDDGLNAALEEGARIAAGWYPRSALAALSSDLPGLVPRELDEALGAALSPRCFVVDELGTGTTLLTASAGRALEPSFGAGSRTLHLRSGAVELTGDWPGLRRDVDTPADLAAVSARHLGRFTSEVLRQLPERR